MLRYGSLLSTAIILVGVAVLAWSSRSEPLAVGYRPAVHTPAQLLAGLRGSDPLAIVSLGLLVLIATPVARVASTVVYFLWKRDRVYLAVTGFVLLVLLAGFIVGSSG